MRRTDNIQEVSMVRKALILLLSATLAISLVFFLPGCGQGDKGRADAYIDKGDNYAVKMEAEGKNLESALKGFFETLMGSNPESVGDVGGPLEKYWSALYVSIWLAENADAAYKSVLQLNAAEDQKKYASMMTKISEKTLALLDFIKIWFKNALDVILTKNPTKIRDHLTGQEFVNGQNQMAVMTDEIDKLAAEAIQYKQNKNL
jgi:hypothetical protein